MTLTSTKRLSQTLALATLVLAPTLASAQLTANVSLTSNYKFRGQDQHFVESSAFKPALQGGFDYAHDSGFYVGNWNSTVKWLSNNSLESDLYGGYKFKAAGVDFDLGLITYLYPGNSVGNTTEIYAGATWGPVTAKYSSTVSKDYFYWYGNGKGRGTGYFNLAYAQELAKGLTLKASLGYTNFKGALNNAGTPDYTDYSLGLSYDLGNGFSLAGTLIGATKKDAGAFIYLENGKSINRNVLQVTLTKSM